MEKDKFKEVVKNIKERIELEVGINPLTNEEGLKINGMANQYDIEFIENNRDKIIPILKEIEKEEIELEKKKEVKIRISEEIYNKLREEAIEKTMTLEQIIVEKLN